MSDLITQRLVLRPFTMNDAHDVTRYISAPDVHRWITRAPHPFGMQDAEDFITRHETSADMVCAVTQDNAVIGCCSLGEELGYWIAKPFWGAGYATEAARALVAHHFGKSALPVLSGYLTGNSASARVLDKLGFQPAGLRHRHSCFYDRDVIIHSMELTRQWWAAQT